MGIAFASTLAPDGIVHHCRTQNQFLAAGSRSQLPAEGHVVQRGRTVGYVECEVTDENGKLVAKSNSTCFVLRGEQASGR